MNRKQKVIVNGAESVWADVLSGSDGAAYWGCFILLFS